MSVLVVLTSPDEAAHMVRWGARFARARGTGLALLHVAPGPRPSEPEDVPLDVEGGRPAWVAVRAAVAELEALFPCPRLAPAPQAAGEGQEPAQPPPPVKTVTFRSVVPSDPLQAVLAEIKHTDADLLVVGKHEAVKGKPGEWELALPLLKTAPCDTLLLRPGLSSGKKCDKILVPASGGPHAPVALKLADRMAHDDDAILSALYVEPEAGDDARIVGRKQIEKALRRADVDIDSRVAVRVELADSPTKGIARVVEEGFDLVLVGASDQSFGRRILFGTIPDKLLSGSGEMAVGVIRRARPLVQRWREALERVLSSRVPQLARADRIDLFERLQNGSELGFDFMALMCLATGIAGMGLLADSAAVVIGAMLVAPLMTPMIGAGLGLVQGNVVLVRKAAWSIAVGFLAALSIGFVLGWVVPDEGLTGELLARGKPTRLDLGVALLSGIAGAFAVARPNLLGALPGVAIAAALVPPIATCGISLARGEVANGEGALFLFLTNLLALVLATAGTLYAVGVRADPEKTARRLWARRTLLALFLGALLIAFGAGGFLISKIRPVRNTELKKAIQADLARGPIPATFVSLRVDTQGEERTLVLELEGPAPLAPERIDELAGVAREVLATPVRLRVITRLVAEGRKD